MLNTAIATDTATPIQRGNTDAHRNRAVKILAKSIYRELSGQGYSEKQIVALATELIGAVTREIAASND